MWYLAQGICKGFRNLIKFSVIIIELKILLLLDSAINFLLLDFLLKKSDSGKTGTNVHY